MAEGAGGLRIIDVSNPLNPQEVASVATQSAVDVFVSGGYAYLAGTVGVSVVDIANPLDPQLAGYYETPGIGRNVFVSGGTAYVANLDGGLLALRLTGGAVGFAISGQVVLQYYLGDRTTQPVTVSPEPSPEVAGEGFASQMLGCKDIVGDCFGRYARSP